MNTGRIAEQIERLAGPVALDLGLELVQVQYRREAGGWVLRLLIDRDGGVKVEDCKRLSRELGDVLDVEDPIPTPYRLEVSSPGLDRPLVKPEDFQRFAGQRIVLQTEAPISGRKKFTGELVGLRDGVVLIEVDGTRYEIEQAGIATANLVPDIGGLTS